jgi:uncharacterized protein Yka (UPF0111/DUF47 family)
MKLELLRKSDLEGETDVYLDMVIRGGLLFSQGVKFYVDERLEEFESRLDILVKLENKADTQLTHVEGLLYRNREMKEWRGDILGIVENIDDILNRMKKTLIQFSVEVPDIPPALQEPFVQLAFQTVSAVEPMIAAFRNYFRKPDQVREKIEQSLRNKKETLILGEKIRRIIFRGPWELSHKFHLRDFTYHMETTAWAAERVCDRLAIATIKKYA